jgi:hypothetical protein
MGTIQYHLEKLEKAGRITSEMFGIEEDDDIIKIMEDI